MADNDVFSFLDSQLLQKPPGGDVPPRADMEALTGAVEPSEAKGRGEKTVGIGGMVGTSTSMKADVMNPLTRFGLSLATDDKERALYLKQRGFDPFVEDKKMYFKDKAGKVYDPEELTGEERAAFMAAREGPMMGMAGLSFATPLGKLASPLGSMAERFARVGGAGLGGKYGAKAGDKWYNFLRSQYGYSTLTPEQEKSREFAGGAINAGLQATGEIGGALGAANRLRTESAAAKAAQEERLKGAMAFEVGKKGVERVNLAERVGNLTVEEGDKSYNRIVDALTGVAIRDAAGSDIPEIRALGRETVSAMGKRRDRIVGAYFDATRGMQDDLGAELKAVVAPHVDKVLGGDIGADFQEVLTNVKHANPNVNVDVSPSVNRLLTEGANLRKGVLPQDVITKVKEIEARTAQPVGAKAKEIMAVLKARLGRMPNEQEIAELRGTKTPATVGDLLTFRDKLSLAAKTARKPGDQIALTDAVNVADKGLAKLTGLKKGELTRIEGIRARYEDFQTTLDRKMSFDMAKSKDPLEALDTLVGNSRKHPRAARMLFDAMQKQNPDNIELFKNAWIEKLTKTQSTTEAIKAIGDMDPRILKQMFGPGQASKLSNWYKFPNQLRAKRAEIEFWMKTPEGQAAYQAEARRIIDDAGGPVGQEIKTASAAGLEAFQKELTDPKGMVTRKAKYAAAGAVAGYGSFAHTPRVMLLAAPIIAREKFLQSIGNSPRASDAYFKWLNSPTARTARQAAYYTTRALLESIRPEPKPPETKEMKAPLSPALQFIKQATPPVPTQPDLMRVEENKTDTLKAAVGGRDNAAIDKAVKRKDLTPNQGAELLRDAARPRLGQEARNLSLPDMLQAVKLADPEERKQLIPLLKNKYKATITTFDPQTRQKLQQEFGQALMQGAQ